MASLNKFWSVSNRNNLNLSIQPSNNRNRFNTSSCLIWTFLFEGFNVEIDLYSSITSSLSYTDMNISSEFTNSKMSSTNFKTILQLIFFNMKNRKNINDMFYTYLNKSDILPNTLGKHLSILLFLFKGIATWCTFGRAFCQSISHEPLCHLMNVFVSFQLYGVSVWLQMFTAGFVRGKLSHSDLTCKRLLTNVLLKSYLHTKDL